MSAATRLMMLIKFEVEKRLNAALSYNQNVTAPTAITAVRPRIAHIFVPIKTFTPLTAITCKTSA